MPKAYPPFHAHVFTNGEEDSSYEKNNYANEELDGEDYVSTSLLTNPPLAAPSSESVEIGEPASVKIESERGRARSDATVKQPSPIFLIDKTEAIKIITNLYKLIKDYLDEKKCEPFYKVDIQLDEDYLITYMITDEFGNIDKTTVSRSIAELVDEYKIKVLDMNYNLTFCGRAIEVDVIAGSPLKAPSTLTIGKNAKIIITEGGFVQPGLKIICTDKTSIFIATKGEVIDSAPNIDYATSAEEIYCLGSNAGHLTEHHE